ncbi:hypothetical protein CLM85_01065 [Streptomyces albidoflavus]|nr:hypothetical protein CLM81_18610 [Streptomyces albidoflavus]PAX90596.1 hypothetical protein CLM82_14330 [Streptomyces albidoflavus]PBO17808.1 hypothetical protein CLM83_16035 [Streptomyces albidoflavus]PBO26032.1 hypothetical protein CLM85_01065 [Streptomyces albidoflavus]PBO29441.1 hypothetical protein CLM84_14095 [Streptomyces albidoflavus]
MVACARGAAGEPADWFWIAGVLAGYAGVGFLPAPRAQRRGGAARPLRAALRDLGDRESPQPPGRYLRSRLVLVGGGLLMAGAAALTSGARPPRGGRGGGRWALYDHRTERRRGEGA